MDITISAEGEAAELADFLFGSCSSDDEDECPPDMVTKSCGDAIAASTSPLNLPPMFSKVPPSSTSVDRFSEGVSSSLIPTCASPPNESPEIAVIANSDSEKSPASQTHLPRTDAHPPGIRSLAHIPPILKPEDVILRFVVPGRNQILRSLLAGSPIESSASLILRNFEGPIDVVETPRGSSKLAQTDRLESHHSDGAPPIAEKPLLSSTSDKIDLKQRQPSDQPCTSLLSPSFLDQQSCSNDPRFMGQNVGKYASGIDIDDSQFCEIVDHCQIGASLDQRERGDIICGGLEEELQSEDDCDDDRLTRDQSLICRDFSIVLARSDHVIEPDTADSHLESSDHEGDWKEVVDASETPNLPKTANSSPASRVLKSPSSQLFSDHMEPGTSEIVDIPRDVKPTICDDLKNSDSRDSVHRCRKRRFVADQTVSVLEKSVKKHLKQRKSTDHPHSRVDNGMMESPSQRDVVDGRHSAVADEIVDEVPNDWESERDDLELVNQPLGNSGDDDDDDDSVIYCKSKVNSQPISKESREGESAAKRRHQDLRKIAKWSRDQNRILSLKRQLHRSKNENRQLREIIESFQAQFVSMRNDMTELRCQVIGRTKEEVERWKTSTNFGEYYIAHGLNALCCEQ